MSRNLTLCVSEERTCIYSAPISVSDNVFDIIPKLLRIDIGDIIICSDYQIEDGAMPMLINGTMGYTYKKILTKPL